METKSNVSWKPARVLDIPSSLKDSRFVYRWVAKKQDGRISKMKQEGWVIDEEISKKLEPIKTISDGSKIDSTTQVRELIVMKLPKELKTARDAFYASRSGQTVASAESEGPGLKTLNRLGHVPK